METILDGLDIIGEGIDLFKHRLQIKVDVQSMLLRFGKVEDKECIQFVILGDATEVVPVKD
jgi:hypothetical protein